VYFSGIKDLLSHNLVEAKKHSLPQEWTWDMEEWTWVIISKKPKWEHFSHFNMRLYRISQSVRYREHAGNPPPLHGGKYVLGAFLRAGRTSVNV